jgi:hypothetical protein
MDDSSLRQPSPSETGSADIPGFNSMGRLNPEVKLTLVFHEPCPGNHELFHFTKHAKSV